MKKLAQQKNLQLPPLKVPKDTPAAQKNKPACIVGIGASAGGLDALEQFFDNMTADSGMAFVVIQHLSPDFKSQMVELLSHHTRMPIHVIKNNCRLEPDHIYLIPPTFQATIKNGRFLLSKNSAEERTHLLIDMFFKSLALEAGGEAIGVILSGTGTDGTQGIQAINNGGGLVIVQTPDSARFDGMPTSAIDTGLSDFILPPDQIPAILMDYVADPLEVHNESQREFDKVFPKEENGFAEINALLLRSYNLDFSRYKQTTVCRRIRRRMDFCSIIDVDDYAALLSDDRDELQLLYKDLLVGVTGFFRDLNAFQYVESVTILQLFMNHRPEEELRVWSVGCSTGEEAYSLAILMKEKAAELNFTGAISVFATDVNKHSLAVASQGVYSRERLANVSPDRLERHFIEVGSNLFKVSPELRKLLIFSPHDLISDPPFSKINLVCCRNLLIYLQPDTQKRVISLLHFALNKDGILFLGSSEGLSGLAGEFEILSSEYKLFRKTSDQKLQIVHSSKKPVNKLVLPVPEVKPAQSRLVNIDRQMLHDYDTLLDRHIPPGVLINEKHKILHYFDNVAEYLKTPERRVETGLLLLHDDNLQVILNTSLQRARRNGQSIVVRDIRIQSGEEKTEYLVNLTVDPIPDTKSSSVHFHVHFERVPAERPDLLIDLSADDADDFKGKPYSHQHGKYLEMKLLSTRLNLKTSQENLQAMAVELQATTEAFQLTNEELQATNEELRATNEESHSTNEELNSVNIAFERTNAELKCLSIEHDNMLNSIESGVIFLDRQLCIRRFNPAIASFFTLLPQDIGRPLDNITYHLDDREQKQADIQHVLMDGVSIEKEIIDRNGKWLLIRVMPFKDEAGQVDGVVITYTDISKGKEAEQTVNMLNDELNKVNDKLELRVAERTKKLVESRAELKTQHVELQQTYQDMEKEVAKRILAIEELRKNKLLLIQQSRMAAMGEMLGNIAHQWRQPLTSIGATIQTIRMAWDRHCIDNKFLESAEADAQKQITYMSDTIEDFRNFFSPDKVLERFDIKEKLQKVVLLVSAQFVNSGVNIQVIDNSPDLTLMVKGYQNEFKQSVLNLVSNAFDAIVEKDALCSGPNEEPGFDGLVILSVTGTDSNVIVEVRDNGGGISSTDAENVFEPYFTSKSEGKGTGIGLSISKLIIEENMGGHLSFTSGPEGTVFKIELSRDDSEEVIDVNE